MNPTSFLPADSQQASNAVSGAATAARGAFSGLPGRGLWCVLFVFRALALLIGLDRSPLVPTVQPEVVINDPAVSLSRGQGLVGASFEHSLHGLDRMYAHFPPVFIALQSLVFRVFGFSAITLRASSVGADLMGCAVFLAILYELLRRRIVDRTGFLVGGVLLVLEPTTLIHAREGRMDTLNVLLGGIALYLCLRAERSTRFRLSCWMSAGAVCGIAMASHPASIVMWAAVSVYSLFRFRELGFLRWLAVNVLPACVPVFIWLATYGAKTMAAFRQLRQIAAYAPPPSLRIAELISDVSRHDFRGVQNSGGLALALTIGALAASIPILLRARGKEKSPLLRFAAIVAAQCVLLQFVVPASGMNRVILILPFALVLVSVMTSRLNGATRTGVLAGAALVVLAEVGLTGGYLVQLRSQWNERSAQRFDRLVSSIPPNARTVAVPELWFAFRSRNRQIALIFHTLDEEKYWSQVPGAFDGYDVVILDPNAAEYQSLYRKAERGRPVRFSIDTYKRTFAVLARRLNPVPDQN